jgi:hypothetical protein
MVEQDKRQFKAMMNAITVLFGKQEFDKELLRLWWTKLCKYDIAIVSNALDKWVDTKKFLPTIADIIELCKAQEMKTFDVALPKPKHTEEQIKQNQEMLDKEIAKLNKRKDHRKWARDIMANPKNFPDISIRFAKEALGMAHDTIS